MDRHGLHFGAPIERREGGELNRTPQPIGFGQVLPKAHGISIGGGVGPDMNRPERLGGIAPAKVRAREVVGELEHCLLILFRDVWVEPVHDYECGACSDSIECLAKLGQT